MDQQQNINCFQQLHQILQQQCDQVSAYIDYLQHIKNSIAENQTDQLEQMLSLNASKIGAIEQIQKQQAKMLDSFGFSHDDAGLEACIQACDQQQRLSTLKQTLKHQLQQLEKSLLINGLLIRKNQDRVKQSIRILSGHHPSLGESIYCRQGNTTTETNDRHSIAVA